MGRAIAILVLVVYPIVELAVAWWVASLIGWGATIWLFVLGAVIGIVIMRRAGGSAARTLRSASAAGDLPTGEVGDHALLFLAGLLVAMPGFVTDVLGLLLLIPPLRRLVRRGVGRGMQRRLRAAGYSVVSGTGADGSTVRRVVRGDVVEGVVVDRRDDPPTGAPGDHPGEDPRGGSGSGPSSGPGTPEPPPALPGAAR